MTFIIDKTTLGASLDALQADATNWTNTTYKKCNDELVALLARGVDVARQIQGNRVLLKQLKESLTERRIPCNENSKLETRIARWVFGDCGDRVYTYASVIRDCLANKIDGSGVAAHITKSGGIDAIRRAGGSNTDSKKQKEYREKAETYYFACDALFTFPDELPQLAPAETNKTFSVALVRQSDDGELEVVYGTNNGTLVNSVLAIAGKELKDLPAQANARKNAAKLSDVIDSVVASEAVSE